MHEKSLHNYDKKCAWKEVKTSLSFILAVLCPKRVTSLRCQPPRHSDKATQLLA